MIFPIVSEKFKPLKSISHITPRNMTTKNKSTTVRPVIWHLLWILFLEILELKKRISELNDERADMMQQNDALSEQIGDKDTARDLQQKYKVRLFWAQISHFGRKIVIF